MQQKSKIAATKYLPKKISYNAAFSNINLINDIDRKCISHDIATYGVDLEMSKNDFYNKLKETINKSVSLPVFFCGRLANYQYINQDEAILQGFSAAKKLRNHFK